MSNILCKLHIRAMLPFLLGVMSSEVYAEAYVDSASGGELQLEEIVVTAQKRSENLQTVPISVSAFTGSRIKNSVVRNATDISILTPNVNVVASVGFVKPFIRGVGTSGNGAGVEGAVSTYVDGVYLVSTPAAFFTFSDVERIEVLKGPQGTLFGRNATGGLFHIITKDPSDEFELSAEASYANYNTFSINAYASGALTDRVGVSISGQYLKQGDGYGTNFFNGTDVNITNHDASVRGKLVFDISDETTLKLSGDYTDRDAPLNSFRVPFGFKPKFTASADIPSARPWDTNTDVENVSQYKGGGGSARIEHEFESMSFLSLTAYRKSTFDYGGDVDATPIMTLGFGADITESQFTQELQLQSQDESLIGWVVGAFYLDATAKGHSFTDFTDTILGVPFNKREITADFGTKSISGFGEVTINVTEETKLTAGLRYTYEKRTNDFEINAIFGDGSILNLEPLQSQEKSFKKLTWRIALDHKFSEDMLGYISYNRGFKSGGYSFGFPQDVGYEPETIDAFEVGIKTELANNAIRLNIAGFYYKYKNMQVSFVKEGSLGLTNGAASELYGIDAELDAIVNEYVSLNAGFGWVHARFTEYPNGILHQPDPVGGAFIQTLGVDHTGNRTPNSPDFTLNLGTDFHYVTENGEVGLSLSYSYNDGYFTEPDNILSQSSFHMLNATARWVSPDEMYNVKIWGKNLFNEAVANQMSAGALNGLVSYQNPRTYGITVGVNF